mmetsp:Transcript_37101/g.54547  ORF Transcript_37101/g.54547 Transcript_37101/m.54547 type:complete len:208 (-) Transcript_37101:303-926(-)|eukprot:CAMPEP_0195525554 /NCGR_PEP_ID=MMETSP0794_2-20130614/26037_1 /TAXON_ID=515487 /ORGANISM="Stephanopyxis turris, Strain CCMP 815" /LENGTH=207 /DNA_ID=CAMNT_0040656037 /DNA_START=184 /DNA_END=807 /DNA_ORIENTATION=+
MIATIAASTIASIIVLSSTESPITPTPSVPVLEIIKTYGSLAGPTCYGNTAPSGSSCQLPLSYLKGELLGSDTSLTKQEFVDRLDALPFQWPLKPFGVTPTSYRKTAVMNKGAETAIYMNELESRGLFDRRNPTGPLPTSLRPKLNAELDREGVDPETSSVVFKVLAGGKNELTSAQLDEAFNGKDVLDYYEFLELIGSDGIRWPKY